MSAPTVGRRTIPPAWILCSGLCRT